jgi:hypothetical protein
MGAAFSFVMLELNGAAISGCKTATREMAF